METKQNPLGKYLKENKITQAEFALQYEAACGLPLYQSNISKWCTGRVKPGLAARRFIAQATKGLVPVNAWQ